MRKHADGRYRFHQDGPLERFGGAPLGHRNVWIPVLSSLARFNLM